MTTPQGPPTTTSSHREQEFSAHGGTSQSTVARDWFDAGYTAALTLAAELATALTELTLEFESRLDGMEADESEDLALDQATTALTHYHAATH